MTDRHIKGDSARPDEAWGYHNATDPTFRVWSDQTKLVIKPIRAGLTAPMPGSDWSRSGKLTEAGGTAMSMVRDCMIAGLAKSWPHVRSD
jgi:hypothetical protein